MILEQTNSSDTRPILRENAITITADDGTQYESDSIELLDRDSDALQKRPVAIEMRCHDYSLRRFATFRVTQGGGYADELTVRGDDPMWVRALHASLLERIESAESSDSWITHHPTLVRISAHLSVGVMGDWLITALVAAYFTTFGLPHVSPQIAQAFATHWAVRLVLNPTTALPIKWATRYALGAVAWPYVGTALWAAYPNVELMIGPTHLRKPERRRQTINFIGAAVVLPIVLAIVYDVMKVLQSSQ